MKCKSEQSPPLPRRKGRPREWVEGGLQTGFTLFLECDGFTSLEVCLSGRTLGFRWFPAALGFRRSSVCPWYKKKDLPAGAGMRSLIVLFPFEERCMILPQNFILFFYEVLCFFTPLLLLTFKGFYGTLFIEFIEYSFGNYQFPAYHLFLAPDFSGVRTSP